MILSSSFSIYFHAFFPRVPGWHWVVMGGVALVLAVLLRVRRRGSVPGAVMFGLAVLMGLFLLDSLALIRMGSRWVGDSGLDLGAELRRMMSGNEEILFLMLFNAGVFVPFGLFLSGFFLLTGKGRWRSLWMATLVGLGLSLLIESIQLVFHIGIFELTDLLLNTLGTFVGAALPLGGRFLDAILLKFFYGGGYNGLIFFVTFGSEMKFYY